MPQPLDTPLVNDDKQPVLALTVFCMDEQVKIVEKLKEAIEYISSLTPAEFEGRKDVNGMIVKIHQLA